MKASLVTLNFAYQIIISTLQFLLYVFVARSVSVDENGIFVMGMLLANVIGNLGILGLNTSSIYFVNSVGISLREVFFKMLKIWFFLVLFIFPILFSVFSYVGEDVLPGIEHNIIMLGLTVSIFIIFVNLLYSIFQAISRFDTYNYFSMLCISLQLVFIFLFYLNEAGSVEAYLVIILFSYVLTSVLVVLKARKFISPSESHRKKKSKLSIKNFITFGLKSHLSNVIAFLMSRLDVYMIGIMLSPGKAGIYLVAVLFVERLGLVSQSVSTILYPSLASLNTNKEKQYRLIYKTFALNFLITLILAVLISVLIYPLILLLYGLEYLGAVYIYFCLVAGVVAKAGARVLSVSMTAFGRPELNLYVALIMIVTNITLNLLLIPLYGVYGAALATSISYLTNLIIKIAVIRAFIFRISIKKLVPDFETIRLLISYISNINR